MAAVMSDPAPSHRLSLARIAEAATGIAPELAGSPQLVCEPLAAAVGCRLTLKVETVNPIRSFKGRGADFYVAHQPDRGALVCASAGNFGQGMAYACRRHGRALTVFASERVSPLQLDRMRGLGATVQLAGDDFEAAKHAARAWAAERGARFVEDGAEPRISEGAGSIAVELLARGDGFDAIVVPLGDGALINGIARWIKAAAPRTQVIGVASRGAPAFHDVWRQGGGGGGGPAVAASTINDGLAVRAPVATAASTIADGLAVRAPVAAAVADAIGLVDRVVLVDDDALIAAMRLLHQHAGLVAEPSGAAGIAAILADPAAFAGAAVATVVTGGNLTPSQLRMWLS